MNTNPASHPGVAPAALPPRRARFRLVGVLVAVAALMGFALSTAAPASAEVGYDISYSIRNDTRQTLYLERAISPGQGCDEHNLYRGDCPNPNVDASFRVSPQVVQPGQTVHVYSKADLLGRDKYFIKVEFRIGSTKTNVVLYANRNTPDYDDEAHTCHITHEAKHTGHFECDSIRVGRLRDFVLRQDG